MLANGGGKPCRVQEVGIQLPYLGAGTPSARTGRPWRFLLANTITTTIAQVWMPTSSVFGANSATVKQGGDRGASKRPPGQTQLGSGLQHTVPWLLTYPGLVYAAQQPQLPKPGFPGPSLAWLWGSWHCCVGSQPELRPLPAGGSESTE